MAGKQGLISFLNRVLCPDLLHVVDVGANPLGAPLYAPLMQAGLAHVWGFEPNEEACARLRAQAGECLTVLDKAIGAPGGARFHAYPASEMSSIYPLSAQSLGYLGHFKRHLGTQTQSEITLHALDDLNEVPAIDLLKVDAQGAERDVIIGAKGKLAGAVAVVAEMRFYRLYEGEPDLWELDKALRDQGFVLHRFLHQKARMLGHSQRASVNPKTMASQLIDGDALYIRNLEDREKISDMQLKKLALLAAGLFDSHDLVLWCLDELAARGGGARGLARDYVALLPLGVKRDENRKTSYGQ